MAFAQLGVLLPASAQIQGGPQALEGTATLAVGASVTGNSLVGFLVTGALAVAGAATSGSVIVENGVVIRLRWYARVRHPYTRM